MSIEIPSTNIIILEGIPVGDPEAKRAFTLIGQWISNVEKKLNSYIEEQTAKHDEKKRDRQFRINIVFTAAISIETLLLVLLAGKVI